MDNNKINIAGTVTAKDLFLGNEGNGQETLQKTIKGWPEDFIYGLIPFVSEHTWRDSESIDIFRVVGTQHPDYIGMTWIELLEKGKRMGINLRLFESNPGYYKDKGKKQPSMYYQSIDGGDLYVGADGNHRTCIARAFFSITGQSVVHGVTIDNYKIDWEMKKAYDGLNNKINRDKLNYYMKVVTKIVSREDSEGWMRERQDVKLYIRDTKKDKEFLLDSRQANEFANSLGKRKGILDKILNWL